MAAHINDNETVTLKEALQRFVEVYFRGQQFDIDEFVQQFPQHEAQLRKRIRDLREIDTLFDSIFQAEGSEFEDEGHDLVGRKVGSFEITEIIGRGGMGIVYLARDTKLKRSVAIKSLPAKLAADLTARTRFRREAELLASLNHPNIAVIYEVIEEEKSGYLVLEYVSGETLAERIAHEPLKLDEALSIGRQVAEAVSAAHEKGVVHRDLKPSNIKITPDGRVKVLDFGLAKAPSSEGKNGESTATHPGRVIGTPAYMSPEQARGKETDHRTDIWSFGCTMYQMLTGHLPFEGETATDTLARIIEREPDWELLPKDTPLNIRTLLRRCLEKDLDQRLGDIADVVIEITETLGMPQVTLPVRLRRNVITIGLTVIVVLSCVAVWFALTRQAQPSSKNIRLVVLPFENLGPAEEEYFAAGITDEITARLAGIHGLCVISRQSALQYKNKKKAARQIAKELNVEYILEGTFQRERPSDPNGRVKIRPQLIRAADDAHVWADIYENNMSEIFRLQSDVAEQVAQALDITLLEPERKALATRPTEKIEAYNYYVRGNEYSSRPYQDKDNAVIAIQMYEKAVELDDNFALAHARLSEVHSGMYKFHDRSEERLALAWEASEKALKLDPELSEAHWARGVYYYWGHSEYDRALKELKIARKSQPNNSQILRFIAYVQRRQGKYEEALTNITKASELDPLSSSLAMALGNTFRDIRKFTEAERYYERAILLAPDEDHPHLRKASLYLVWKGSTQEARAALERASQYINLSDNERIVNLLFRLDLLERNYQGALAGLPLESPATDALSYSDALRYAQIYGFMEDQKSAKKYYGQAMQILESKVKEYPNKPGFHGMLGIAYAGLGLEEDAIQEGERAVELLPYTKNSEYSFIATKDLAYIYMMVGKFDAAIDQIKYLLSIPGELSIPLLEIDPAWNPLRKHPRFKKLLESDN
ncbi:protein kinase [Planctomycetota bacterium]